MHTPLRFINWAQVTSNQEVFDRAAETFRCWGGIPVFHPDPPPEFESIVRDLHRITRECAFVEWRAELLELADAWELDNSQLTKKD